MLRNMKPGHRIILILLISSIVFLQMYARQTKATKVANQMTRELANELIATENELLQYEELQRIEQLQQDYKEQAMNVEEFANLLRKTQNTIRDRKRELFNTRGIDIVADYHTNQEDGYKVTIDEGNGVLYVEIEYFEVTTGSRSIPE